MIKIPPIYCSGYGFKGVAGFSNFYKPVPIESSIFQNLQELSSDS